MADDAATAADLGTALPHSNLLCRNFPPDMNIGVFQQMFRKFGYIEGCRFFPGAVTPYGPQRAEI
ncbi:hypothetical protein HaLaN_06893, partial [Haematococcus lacustris]